MSRAHFSPAVIDEIVRGHAAGQSGEETAATIGTSVGSLRSTCSQLRISRGTIAARGEGGRWTRSS